jgi:hypothetical protein
VEAVKPADKVEGLGMKTAVRKRGWGKAQGVQEGGYTISFRK